jgi:hypothetical protein
MDHNLLNPEFAKLHQDELLREAAHSRLVANLSYQPRRILLTLALRAVTRCRAVVAELGRTKPVRRRVLAWMGQGN